MEIRLKENYGKLGNAMDVVTVKDGYARNFLIPEGIAVPATEGNKRSVVEQKKYASKKEAALIDEAKKIAKKIENVPCTMPVKVKGDDELFGSVSTQDIADFLKRENFNVSRSDVELDEPIKKLGVYNVMIKLHKEVSAKLKVWVVKEEKEEA